MKALFSPDSVAVYGLFDTESLRVLRTRLEEAQDVLLDPTRRRPYEMSVIPSDEGRSGLATPQQVKDRPRPTAPFVGPDTEVNGSLLRAVREAQGVDLAEISRRTKVGTGYLHAIEEDDFAALPAPVYVRGFVAEIAKVLELDGPQTSRSYVQRYRHFLEHRGDL
jgi:flagellar biosynthesis protein FlhG